MSDRDFFRLGEKPTNIDQDEFFRLTKSSGRIASKVYLPSTLKSPYEPQRVVVANCHFEDVSFSKTLIDNIEFKKCTFLRCLFIAARIERCRFTECAFVESNPYRIEFENTYINPLSFEQCLDRTKYQNIGVYLYHELLNNSRKQSQPDFTQNALFLFRRWTRYQDLYRLRTTTDWRAKLRLRTAIATNFAQDKLIGFGVRVGSFLRTALIVVALLTAVNYVFAHALGLGGDTKINSIVDAFYFTVITLTTIGYGDITPTTQIGRAFISAEGMLGFLSFAILASMLYRKILP